MVHVAEVQGFVFCTLRTRKLTSLIKLHASEPSLKDHVLLAHQVIEVGTGSFVDRSTMFMSWTDVNKTVDVKALGISMWDSADGYWQFDTTDGTVSLHCDGHYVHRNSVHV